MNRALIPVLFLLVTLLLCPGCLVTRTVTVPLRVGGVAAGAVPCVGGTVQKAADTTAGAVDKVPF